VADTIGEYGSVVCHYTRSETAFEHILPNQQLRFSPYRRMRDPMEARGWVFGAAHFPENFDGVDDEMATYGKAHDAANKIKSEAKLLALTTDAPAYRDGDLRERMFGRGWARARMWELYGGKHRGACLVFDKEKLREELKESLSEAGVGALFDGEVEYTHTGLAGAHISFHLDDFKKSIPEAVATFIERNYHELFLLKAAEWESEFEYRYLAVSDDSEFVFGRFSASLKAVVVGQECPSWQWLGVLDLCRQVGATAYRLHWLPEGPFPAELAKDLEAEGQATSATGDDRPSES
jgi:hypothetical protein